MAFDDMSDEDKQALLAAMKANSSQSSPSSDIGSLNPSQTPSFASQNVDSDTSQSLNNNENNIDSQRAAKLAAFAQMQQDTDKMAEHYAQGLGGMGSVEARAMQELEPVAQSAIKAATPVVEDAASGLQKVFPKLQKYFQAGTTQFPAANTAEAMKVHQALEQAGTVGPNRILSGPFYK